MIIIFEAIFTVITTILILLSYITLRAIRHLGVGKQFWIPVIASSTFFLISSLLTIFWELGFSIIIQTAEIVQIFRIAALCVLVVGVYSYSRKVKASLTEEISVSKQIFKETLEADAPLEQASQYFSKPQNNFPENTKLEKKNIEFTQECRHKFGYLRTLPRNASIPDECLGCNKLIKCKHNLATTLESNVNS